MFGRRFREAISADNPFDGQENRGALRGLLQGGAPGQMPNFPGREQEPVVVVNFDRNGDAADRKANASYGNSIMSIFAAMRS